jgi:hypothetical protein
MNATVYKKLVKGPATHAIVIGVGSYPYLKGGKGKPKFENAGSMGQLKSPPESARVIARWLIEHYQHPDKPLASVALLLSDAKSQSFEFLSGGKKSKVKVPLAVMAEVSEAVTAWHGLGDANADHLLLFFFCGHGIAASPDLALLLADFGAKPKAPLDGAIDFGLLRQNMDECRAREQCYFIDACRIGSDLLIKNAGFAGLPIIQKTGAFNQTGRNRQAPAFYSTLADAPAFAQSGKPSLFTEALLQGFKGAGCDERTPGQWQVQTNLLHNALNQLLIDASERLEVPQRQINPTDDLTLIKLNAVATPEVPVVVGCRPPDANGDATLVCKNDTHNARRGPNQKKRSWKFSVPLGEYDFAAKFKTAKFKSLVQRRVIRPAFPLVELDVKP